MNNQNQITISSVKGFLSKLDLNHQDTPQPLFRGEHGIFPKSCCPSLFRLERKKPINIEEEIEGFLYERKRVRNWYQEVTLLESQRPLNQKFEIEKLILAQHYGIKTRLLDWTTNPLIALWFACSDYDNITNDQEMYAVYEIIPPNYFLDDDGSNEWLEYNHDRTLAFKNPYCLNYPNTVSNSSLTPFEEIHFIQPIKYLDDRIYKQSSILSIHPNSKQQIKAINTYIIDKIASKNILYELGILGIDFNTTGLATRDAIAKKINHSFVYL